MAWLSAYFRSLKEKMVKDPLSPEAVAGGWALGMFVGCAIPFGLQLIISIPLSLMLRVSKIGATLGTFITNPITIWFIYPAQTMFMNWLLKRGMTWNEISESMTEVVHKGDWNTLLSLSGEGIICFLLGGILLALVMSPITYFVVKSIVVHHRSKRKKTNE